MQITMLHWPRSVHPGFAAIMQTWYTEHVAHCLLAQNFSFYTPEEKELTCTAYPGGKQMQC